jgi:hypothetical protein
LHQRRSGVLHGPDYPRRRPASRLPHARSLKSSS